MLKKRFYISNYDEVERPLSIKKTKKVIGLMENELVEKIMRKFVLLRPKTNS